MTAREITEELRNMMDEEYSTWFAIHQTAEDTDDGTGSNDPKEAAEMAVKSDAYSIVLIYDNGSDETYDELVIKGTTCYQIEARRTNDPTQADGYSAWEYAGEWNAEDADDALDQWLDEQVYETEGFERTGEASFRIGDAKYDVRVAKGA